MNVPYVYTSCYFRDTQTDVVCTKGWMNVKFILNPFYNASHPLPLYINQRNFKQCTPQLGHPSAIVTTCMFLKKSKIGKELTWELHWIDVSTFY